MNKINKIPIIAPITKISSRITRILGCNPSSITLQGTNTYLIGSGDKRILVDTGNDNVPEYIKHLENILFKEKISISKIIITHWHDDHIGGINQLKNILKDSEVWKFPRCDEINDDYIFGLKLNYLKNGQELKTEGATLKVVHTPGHTTDHIVLKLLEDNSVFSGDCILGEGTAVFEDLYDYMQSLKKILDLKPEVIYPGHGNIINNPVERINYYINHRNKREQQILDVLKKSNKLFSEDEIVQILYTDTPKELLPFAAANVNNHLNKLLKENKVCQDDNYKWFIKNSKI